MVALVIAAVGSFVSCKDYDDDINNLQKQIDNAALKSDLAALQTTLTSVQSTASKAATDATSALTKAGANASDIAALQTKANELGTQIATAAQNATKGVEDAAKAQAAAEAASTAAQEAKDAIAPAIKAAIDEASEKFNAAIGAKADTATVKALATRLAEAETTLGTVAPLVAANAAAIEALETKAADFETRIAALEAKSSGEGAADAMAWLKAITDVELFGNFVGTYAATQIANNNKLYFLHGVQKDNVFGDAEELLSYVATNDPKTYSSEDSVQIDNRILVRVSPATAVFSKDDIFLMNSKGETLNDLVEILDVEKFTGLITRAGEVNTGLYIVSIAAKKEATDADFAEATYGSDKISSTNPVNQWGKAAYALAINSGKDRYVASSYDLAIQYGYYLPASTLPFNVNTKAVSGLANRWNGEKVIAEDETKANAPIDYLWAASKTGYLTPAVAPIIGTKADGSDSNVTNGDARYGKPRLVLEEYDDDIVINGFDGKVQYVYVTLDKENAIESKPSEFNAWKKYDITNLNTMLPAHSGVTLNINTEAAKGDIIGFRVYGVNYDGTLADPDGVAFYVELGKPASATAVKATGTFKAVSTAGSVLALDIVKDAATSNCTVINVEEKFASFGLADDITLVQAGLAKTATPSANSLKATQTKTANVKTIAADANVQVYYLKSNELKDGAPQFAETVNETKYIAVAVADASNVVDTKTITTDPIDVVNIDNHRAKVATFSIVLTKGAVASKDPNAATPFSWKTGYYKDGVATLYPNIDAAQKLWNAAKIFAASDPVQVPLSLFANNVPTTVKEATLTFDGKKMTVQTDTISYKAATAQFTIDAQWIGENSLIGGKHTAHLKLVTESGAAADKLSRVQKTTVTSISDAKNDTQTKAPDFTAVDADIVFANILDYQVYSNDRFYWAGAKGAVGVKTPNTYYADYSIISGGAAKALRLWYDPLTKQSTAANLATSSKIGNINTADGKVTYIAEKDADMASPNFYNSLAGLLPVAENTAVPSFVGGALIADFYTQDPAYPSTQKVVTKGTGNENEFIKLNVGNDPVTNISFVAVGTLGPTKTENMEYQTTLYDIFGQKHVVAVPFELVP